MRFGFDVVTASNRRDGCGECSLDDDNIVCGGGEEGERGVPSAGVSCSCDVTISSLLSAL